MDDRKIVYPKQRELDGVYTRVERNGHWYSVCFSDLTDEEQDVYDKIQTICKKETALKRVLRNLLSAISFAQI